MKFKIFGLTGLKGSGKDYIFQKYKEKFGNENTVVENIKLASPLKELTAQVFPNSKSWIEDPIKKENPVFEGGKTLRDVMIYIGDLRKFSKNLWVDLVREKINKLIYEHKENGVSELVIFVTDVRYGNEAELIREFNGQIVSVFRPLIGKKILRIINTFGVNFISKFIISIFYPKYSHKTEWNYWKLRKQTDYEITNEDRNLEEGLTLLNNYNDKYFKRIKFD